MRNRVLKPFLAAVSALAVSTSANSQTIEQIREACREQLRPRVQSCVQGKIGMGKEAAVDACRQAASPAMQACVLKATQKVAAGKAAPAAPKEDTAPVGAVKAVPVVFVAPPRTIADITQTLDAEKPDAAKLNKLRDAADAPPPTKSSPKTLAQFYYDRGNVRALLARTNDALADGLKALEAGGSSLDTKQVTRIRQFISLQQLNAGQTKAAIETAQAIVRDGLRGAGINANRFLVSVMIASGNIEQADDYARRVLATVAEARGSPHPSWRSTYPVYGRSWEADADDARAQVLEMRGKFKEAESAYQRALAFRLASLKDIAKYDFPPPPEQVMLVADRILLSIARMKARQGALAQAEADARRALLNVLKAQGKYNPATTPFMVGLADILVEEGRYEEAEKLLRSALDIRTTLAIADETPGSARIVAQLGGVLVLQNKFEEAGAVYKRLEASVAEWRSGKDTLLLSLPRITALYATGDVKTGLAAAEELLRRERARVGDRHIDTASARAAVASGYALAGRETEAVREFKATVPVLMAAGNEAAGEDDPTVVAARRQRLQGVVEAYIDVLVRTQGYDASVATETFALADAIRGRSVQQALAASSARMVAKDPELAELVRTEQDLGKQINAQLGVLNNALAMPAGDRDDGLIRSINATIDKLRGDRVKARQDLNRRFPQYADLVDPRPPSLDQIKAALKPGEVLLSLYFGQTRSFAWAVSRDAGVSFASIPLPARELSQKVAKLREALQPNAETIDEIPVFDLALAYDLYKAILEPVASAWRSEKSFILVTNGDLALLPLSLLPTAPPATEPKSKVAFDSYRDVAWLARTHAVSQIPSVAALLALRQLPAGSPGREPLIAFGDPFFSPEQATEAGAIPVEVAAAATRGLPLKRRAAPKTSEIDSAELAQLPRLPDTADELQSVALALSADPAKALFLGKDASESRVKSANLASYKIVAFATHGLVPGELNGLTQPALALSAPDVSDSDGDGLLTMEEVLALKLDADWVVLSACNTGTGAGAGAEAASGLGRAFFYAGTRALLVTNWSVHSASARELVTDLFRRQADDVTVSRAEALRRAMMATLDEGGWEEEKGKVLFTYAHPLFWAPYTIIGDGGLN